MSLGVLALAAAGLTACGDAGAAITRLTVGSSGPDPYTLVANTDQQVKVRPQAGGTKDAGSPGLYGGTRNETTCDRQRLIAFLQANPDKARAWASVHGIAAADIPQFVSRLTPVLLRTDTLVTNHGYRNGKATSGPAVLQAGMGVLINSRGTPVVKCNCGNPLTLPEKKISTGNATYTGRSWPGFTKKKVTKVQPSNVTIVVFVLVDPDGTIGFRRPRSTAGGADGPPTTLPPTETEPTTSPTPIDSGTPTDSGTGGPTTPSPGTTDGTTPTDGSTPTDGTTPGTGGTPTDNGGTGGTGGAGTTPTGEGGTGGATGGGGGGTPTDNGGTATGGGGDGGTPTTSMAPPEGPGSGGPAPAPEPSVT